MIKKKCDSNISGKFKMSHTFLITMELNKETIYTKLLALGDAFESLLTHESDHVPMVTDQSIYGLQNLFAATMTELELVLFGERYTERNDAFKKVELVSDEMGG